MDGQPHRSQGRTKGVWIIIVVIAVVVAAGLFYKLSRDPEDTAAMMAETPTEAGAPATAGGAATAPPANVAADQR